MYWHCSVAFTEGSVGRIGEGDMADFPPQFYMRRLIIKNLRHFIASSHLYLRVCLAVGWMVRWRARRMICSLFFFVLKTKGLLRKDHQNGPDFAMLGCVACLEC